MSTSVPVGFWKLRIRLSGDDGSREGRAAGPLRDHRGMPVMYRAGQTALAAVIHGAEPTVGAWRNRLDPSAAAGVPAHVSVLSPFLAAAQVDDAVIGALTSLFGSQPTFDVRFTEFRRFPGVLYLAPDPDEPFRALTRMLATRWPEASPQGIQLADWKPHLTVAYEQPAPVFDEVEASLATELPIAAAITAVALFVHDGTRWRQRMTFDLAR
jgi:2'-5' RNA ligase